MYHYAYITTCSNMNEYSKTLTNMWTQTLTFRLNSNLSESVFVDHPTRTVEWPLPVIKTTKQQWLSLAKLALKLALLSKWINLHKIFNFHILSLNSLLFIHPPPSKSLILFSFVGVKISFIIIIINSLSMIMNGMDFFPSLSLSPTFIDYKSCFELGSNLFCSPLQCVPTPNTYCVCCWPTFSDFFFPKHIF